MLARQATAMEALFRGRYLLPQQTGAHRSRSAAGYEWFLALPYAYADTADEPWLQLGWVASHGRDGLEQWITSVDIPCPGPATIALLNEMPAPLRIPCFAGQPITLEGDVTCRDDGPPIPTPSPAWLTWEGCELVPAGTALHEPGSGIPFAGVLINFPPDMARADGHLRITAHLDDPAAATCRANVPSAPDDLHGADLADREW